MNNRVNSHARMLGIEKMEQLSLDDFILAKDAEHRIDAHTFSVDLDGCQMIAADPNLGGKFVLVKPGLATNSLYDFGDA